MYGRKGIFLYPQSNGVKGIASCKKYQINGNNGGDNLTKYVEGKLYAYSTKNPVFLE